VSAIVCEGVTLAVGGTTVLAGVDFAVAEGEFIGVLGGNGAGKTTLMRAVLGLLKPVAGTIRVLGADVRRGNPAIGYLPQARGQPPTARLSGRDFLASALGGERWGLPLLPGRGAAAVDRVLAAVDGADLADLPLTALSGGERQRLLLGEALIGDPRLLVLDEPLISLDVRNQQRVVGLVSALCRERGMTVLFSAHELNQLLPAIDRVLYLGNRQAALGTVAEVVTPAVLSRIYGTPIEVVEAGGRIFVMSGGQDVERAAHRHDHTDGHHHAHL
jgi:zinc/manganese transport system ATP-binding protein